MIYPVDSVIQPLNNPGLNYQATARPNTKIIVSPTKALSHLRLGVCHPACAFWYLKRQGVKRLRTSVLVFKDTHTFDKLLTAFFFYFLFRYLLLILLIMSCAFSAR